MATIKISDLRSTVFTNCEEEFVGAVENAVIRAIEARQLENIRGGLETSKPLAKPFIEVTPFPIWIWVGILVAP